MTLHDNSSGIAILGFPRSGTTLLRRLLNAHSAIDAPGESYLLTACARFLNGQKVVDGVEASVLSGTTLLGIDPDEVLGRLRQLVFDLRAQRALQMGKRRWAEKTAIDIFHLDGIRKVFGDQLSYVCVVRHGLDVVVSVQEWCHHIESYPDELHRYIVQHPQPLVAFAHAWVDAMQALRRFTAELQDRVFVVHYQSLVAEPEGVLHHLLDYLGESWEDGLIEKALGNREIGGFGDWKVHSRREIDPSSVDRWRTLSRGTLAQLAPIVNPELVQWGFDPIEIRISDDPNAALRRYELGLMLHAAERPPGPRRSSGVEANSPLPSQR